MRVVHIITRMIVGGAQENTLLNCRDLIRTFGDDVLLVTGPSPGPEGNLLDRIDVPLRTVPSLVRAIRPVSDLRAYLELKSILRDFRPDIVHTHSAKAGILGRAAAHALKIPVVHTVHGAPFHPYQSSVTRFLYRAAERWAGKRTDALISVADAMTDLLALSGVAPREKFRTIYSGMETGPFLDSAVHRSKTRTEFGFSDDDIVIGKIARLFHLKGHEYVIEAAGNIVRKIPNARFFFIGNGILADRYKSIISERGLERHFVFAGLVPPERIPEMISAMDILVHTSLREGLARVLPQALLAGKPVISYDIDGAREVVLHEETGLLLSPESIVELEDAIIRLAGAPDLRDKYGEEGRKRFSERFEHNFMTRKIRKLYEEIVF